MERWGLERLQKLKKSFWIIETLFPWEGPPGCVALSFLYSLWLSFAVWVRHILYPPEYHRKVLTTYICLHTVRALPGSCFATLLSWWITSAGRGECTGLPWHTVEIQCEWLRVQSEGQSHSVLQDKGTLTGIRLREEVGKWRCERASWRMREGVTN